MCDDCTLRLLRQADEWTNSYRFWSCADIDIKPRKEYRETCSGHGKYLATKCKCDKNYYGSRCQYWDECTADQDCGLQGKCIDIGGTALPRKQCYCKLGWSGPGCNKSTPFNYAFNRLRSNKHSPLLFQNLRLSRQISTSRFTRRKHSRPTTPSTGGF